MCMCRREMVDGRDCFLIFCCGEAKLGDRKVCECACGDQEECISHIDDGAAADDIAAVAFTDAVVASSAISVSMAARATRTNAAAVTPADSPPLPLIGKTCARATSARRKPRLRNVACACMREMTPRPAESASACMVASSSSVHKRVTPLPPRLDRSRQHSSARKESGDGGWLNSSAAKSSSRTAHTLCSSRYAETFASESTSKPGCMAEVGEQR